jgi:hypothetical protein
MLCNVTVSVFTSSAVYPGFEPLLCNVTVSVLNSSAVYRGFELLLCNVTVACSLEVRWIVGLNPSGVM